MRKIFAVQGMTKHPKMTYPSRYGYTGARPFSPRRGNAGGLIFTGVYTVLVICALVALWANGWRIEL